MYVRALLEFGRQLAASETSRLQQQLCSRLLIIGLAGSKYDTRPIMALSNYPLHKN